MPTIALIDDRKKQRESTQIIIQDYLKDNYPEWKCIDIFPFENIDDYISWIGENDIAVIIIDEQLQEESKNGTNVSYDGHNFIDYIRKTHPTFPVFAMTAYSVTDNLSERYGLFDDIIEDNEFSEKPEKSVDRFIRAGQRFTEVYQSELEKLSEISKKIAEGEKIPDHELKQAKAIQERLGIPYTIDNMKNRSHAIDQLNKQLNEFESLTNEIQQFLKK